MNKYYLLYNPIAGAGKNMDGVQTLAKSYESSECVDLTKIGDLAEFIKGLDANDSLVVCGGDGTLNRFVNAIRGVELANDVYYYPAGTGNDFMREIHGDPNATVTVKINDYIKDLPTVTVNGEEYLFVNGVGYGIDGYCCEVGDKLHAENKPVNYTAIAIKGLLFHYKPTNATITVDGVKKEYKKVWIAPTMNGKYYGGGMMPTPEQDRLNKDREISLMVFHGTGKLKTLMIFPSIFKGEHVKNTKAVEVIKGKDITVEFDRPVALQIDGETFLNVSGYHAVSAARVKETI